MTQKVVADFVNSLREDTRGSQLGPLFFDSPQLKIAKGERPFSNGSLASRAIYMLDGYLAEQTEDQFNGITTLAVYGAGDLIVSTLSDNFGELGHSFKAITACDVAIESKVNLFARAQDSEPFNELLYRNLLYQLDLSHIRTENLSLKYASDRLIYRLLFFASRFGDKIENRTVIDLPLTHELLASTINLSRERVSKEMRKLAEKGYLSYRGQKIVIKNMAALQKAIQPVRMQITEKT